MATATNPWNRPRALLEAPGQSTDHTTLQLLRPGTVSTDSGENDADDMNGEVAEQTEEEPRRKKRPPVPMQSIESYVYEECHRPVLTPYEAAQAENSGVNKTKAILFSRLPRYARPMGHGSLISNLRFHSLDDYYEHTPALRGSVRSTCMQPTLNDAGLDTVFRSTPEDDPAWQRLLKRLEQAILITRPRDDLEEKSLDTCRIAMMRLLRSIKWYFCHIQQPVLPPRKIERLNAELACEEEWIAFLCDLCTVWQYLTSLAKAFLRDGAALQTHSVLNALYSLFEEIVYRHVYPLTCAILTEWLEKRRDDIVGVARDGMWNIALRKLVLTLAALVTHEWNTTLIHIDPPEYSHPMYTIWTWMNDFEKEADMFKIGRAYDAYDCEVNGRAKEWLVVWASGLPLIPPKHHLMDLQNTAWHKYRYQVFKDTQARHPLPQDANTGQGPNYHDNTCAQPRSSRFWNAGVGSTVPIRLRFHDMRLGHSWNLTRALLHISSAGCHFPVLQWLYCWVLWSSKWAKFLLDPAAAFCVTEPNGRSSVDVEKLSECISLFERVSRAELQEALRSGNPKSVYVLRDDVVVEIESYMVHALHSTMVVSRLEFLAGNAWEPDSETVAADHVTDTSRFRPTEQEGLDFAHQIIGFLAKETRESSARNILVERFKRMSYGYLLHPAIMPIHAWATYKMPVATRRYLDLLQFSRPSDVNAITTCIYEDTAAVHMFLSACTREPLRVFASLRPNTREDLIASSYSHSPDMFSTAVRNTASSARRSGNESETEKMTATASLMLSQMAPMPLVSAEIRREVHSRLGLLWYAQALESWLDRKAVTSIIQRNAMASASKAGDKLTRALDFTSAASGDGGNASGTAHSDETASLEEKNHAQRTAAARKVVIAELTRLAISAFKMHRNTEQAAFDRVKADLADVMRRQIGRAPTSPGNTTARQANTDATKDMTPFLKNVSIANYSVRSMGSLEDLQNRDGVRKDLRGAIPPVSLWQLLYDVPIHGRIAPLYKFDHVSGKMTCDTNSSRKTPVILGVGHEYWVWSRPGRAMIRTRDWLLALKSHAIMCEEEYGREAISASLQVPTQSPVDPISARVFLKHAFVDILQE